MKGSPPARRNGRPTARPRAWTRSWPANPLDFPFERDAELLPHAGPHIFTESFNVRGGGLAGVDEKIAVLLRNLRRPVLQPPAAGLVDQLPRLVPGRILEGRA